MSWRVILEIIYVKLPDRIDKGYTSARRLGFCHGHLAHSSEMKLNRGRQEHCVGRIYSYLQILYFSFHDTYYRYNFIKG